MEKLLELFAQREFRLAISHAQTELRSCLPEAHAIFHGAIGRAHFELEEFAEAIAALDKAIALNPTYTVGLRNRGQAYLAQGAYQLALADFGRASETGAPFDAYHLLGYTYACLGAHEQAVTAYTTHLAAVFDEWALAMRADSFIALGKNMEARNDWEVLLSSELMDHQHLRDIHQANRISEQPVPIAPESYRDQAIPQLLAEEGFARIEQVSRKNATLDGSGIYALTFAGDEYYVGQAIDLVKRLQTHTRSKPDITAIWVKSVAADRLTVAETAAISLFERQAVRLRNLKQVSFTNLFDTAKQLRWMGDNTYNQVTGERFRQPTLREKYQPRFQELQAKPYYAFLVGFLADYVRKTIPNYLASEYTYWSISCLPRHLLEERCITRININDVPVLSVFADESQNLSVVLFASKAPFLSTLQEKAGFQDTFAELPTLYFQCNESFANAWPDEIRVCCQQEDFGGILNNEVLLSSIRWFNLRMMKNVGSEEASRRTPSHCLPLADVIIQ